MVFAYAVFPWIIQATDSASASQPQGTALLAIQVAIPCPGHAALIIGELKKIAGIKNVEFATPDIFNISYDSKATSPQAITAIDIFKTYKATIK